MEKMRVKLTFIDEILGTASSDPEIHRSYIASKGPDATTIEEELETLTVDEVTEKGMTIFSKDEKGEPCSLELPDSRLFQIGLQCDEEHQGFQVFEAEGIQEADRPAHICIC